MTALPTEDSAAHAFEPLAWRGHVLPSRLMLAPINTGFADAEGRPTARLKRFHEKRSSWPIGVSVVGNVTIHSGLGTNARNAVLSQRSDVPRFATIARGIRRSGSLPGIQLAAAPRDLSPARNWRAHDVAAEVGRLRGMVAGYRTTELAWLMEEFVRSAELARDAGFDLIQVHAAHGYLVSLLLHPATNRRRDSFAIDGEWFPNLVARVRNAARGALVSVRLSWICGIADEATEHQACRLASSQAVAAGADVIDLSAGAYTIDRRLIYPNRGEEPLAGRSFAREILPELDCLVAVAGNILESRDLPSDLEERLLLNVGRALIADPDFALKLATGRDGAVNACHRTGHCHYFTRGKESLSCGSNPDI